MTAALPSSTRLFVIVGIIVGLLAAYVVERYERQLAQKEAAAVQTAFDSLELAYSEAVKEQERLAKLMEKVVKEDQEDKEDARKAKQEANKIAATTEKEWAWTPVPLELLRVFNAAYRDAVCAGSDSAAK